MQPKNQSNLSNLIRVLISQGSGQDVTIFILDLKNASNNEIEAAKTAVKRLKTLRHPNVLSFYDSAEVPVQPPISVIPFQTVIAEFA